MKGVNPRVGTGQSLRDSGHYGGDGAKTKASEGSRDCVSDTAIAGRVVAKPLQKLALERKTPMRLGLGVQR